LRLWALSVDFTEDHRIGKEILSGVSDQYRKLRNTFRYLLGALEGFSDAEKVDVADMPELERYVLHLLADMDAKLRQAVDDFDFNTYVRCLADFANNDLSAFFFDIRKDSLYCDAPTDPKRRAYRTVLDTLFHALVRYAAPVLVFTAEEVWGTRYPEAGSVHLLEWPVIPSPESIGDRHLIGKVGFRKFLRSEILKDLELLRRNKEIGSSLEAEIDIFVFDELLASHGKIDWSELMIANASTFPASTLNVSEDPFGPFPNPFDWKKLLEINAIWQIRVSTHHKCGRCWRHLPEVREDGALCGRCEGVVNG
jgi:isoleucyl-tRNA synthetase